MPRGKKPSIRCWKSCNACCCWINGEQHTLVRGPDDAPGGPTYLAALDQFRKLLAMETHKGTRRLAARPRLGRF